MNALTFLWIILKLSMLFLPQQQTLQAAPWLFEAREFIKLLFSKSQCYR